MSIYFQIGWIWIRQNFIRLHTKRFLNVFITWLFRVISLKIKCYSNFFFLFQIVPKKTSTNAISGSQVVVGTTVMMAPLTFSSTGLQKANVTHGIRQVILIRNKKKEKYGLRFRSLNKVTALFSSFFLLISQFSKACLGCEHHCNLFLHLGYLCALCF